MQSTQSDLNQVYVQPSLFDAEQYARLDLPADLDAPKNVFGSSPKELAAALYETDTTRGGVLINLRGLSGSGKSSVVKGMLPEFERRGIPVLENPSTAQLEEAFARSRRVFVVSLPKAPYALNGVKEIAINHRGMTDEGLQNIFLKSNGMRAAVLVLGLGSISLASEVRSMISKTANDRRVAEAWRMSFEYLVRNFEYAFGPDDYADPNKLLKTIKNTLGKGWFVNREAEEAFTRAFVRSYNSIVQSGGTIESSVEAIDRWLEDQKKDPVASVTKRYRSFLKDHPIEPVICISTCTDDTQGVQNVATNFTETVAAKISGKIIRKALFDCKVAGKRVPGQWGREKGLDQLSVMQAHKELIHQQDTYLRLIVNNHYSTMQIIGPAHTLERMLREQGVSYVVSMTDLNGSEVESYYWSATSDERPLTPTDRPFTSASPLQPLLPL